MRVFIRKKVSEDNIDLLTLKPSERIIVSAINAIHGLSIYKEKKRKDELREYRLRLEKEELLKNAILFNINKYFNSKKRNNVKSVTISVPREHESFLNSILKSKDFVSFDYEVIDIDPDFLLSFPQIPILVKFQRKNIGGGKIEKD